MNIDIVYSIIVKKGSGVYGFKLRGRQGTKTTVLGDGVKKKGHLSVRTAVVGRRGGVTVVFDFFYHSILFRVIRGTAEP